MGSFKGQKSDGFYMNDYLQQNMEVFAERIVDDMMFSILITGNGRVRVGKSVLAQQLGTYITYEVNEKHGLKNKFDVDNIVFKADDLIDKAFELPPYSVVVLDEGDDLTENYWSSLAKKLRRFFRKCGQLNLFFIMLIPDYFELNRSYAITRTECLIDVYFYGDYERGYFNFYNFQTKKYLFHNGKKYGNYGAASPNFSGRFPHTYTVNEAEYRAKKKKDLEDDDIEKASENETEMILKGKLIYKLINEYKESTRTIGEYLNKPHKTIWNWQEKAKSLGNVPV